MSYNIVIPFTSSVGSQFLINFKKFESQEEFSIPVIDVSLVLVDSKERTVSIKDLINISKIIKDYLFEKKVVLYYYCDHSCDDIFISKRHEKMSPQEFRSNLFGSLFDFLKVDNFTKDQIIVEDKQNETTHYISLITKIEDKSNLTEISIKIQEMNDK